MVVQPGLAHVLMTSWALDFESRDCCFLVHESGILPTLQAMVTLTNTADMARSEVSRRIGADTRSKNTLNGESVVSSRQQRWTPWSLDSVREGFVQVMQRVNSLLVSCDETGKAVLNASNCPQEHSKSPERDCRNNTQRCKLFLDHVSVMRVEGRFRRTSTSFLQISRQNVVYNFELLTHPARAIVPF